MNANIPTADVMDELRSSPTISVENYARVMGIGRSLAYSLAREGAIPVIRLGHRLRVPSAAVLRMLEGRRMSPPQRQRRRLGQPTPLSESTEDAPDTTAQRATNPADVSDDTTNTDSVDAAAVEHVSVQLRRRRLAAHRSPRLHDGRRDPISSSRW
jgi:excisionase family DNA binding protein